MSFPTLKRSIVALQLLGAAAIASFIGFSTSPVPALSQISQNTDLHQMIAYRASGRFDTELLMAYRASGRLEIEANDTDKALTYRGSERGVEGQSLPQQTVAYRASGRLSQGFQGAIAYRASGRFDAEPQATHPYRGSERGADLTARNTIAYRASGRFTNLEDTVAYRGSERGITNSAIG